MGFFCADQQPAVNSPAICKHPRVVGGLQKFAGQVNCFPLLQFLKRSFQVSPDKVSGVVFNKEINLALKIIHNPDILEERLLHIFT